MLQFCTVVICVREPLTKYRVLNPTILTAAVFNESVNIEFMFYYPANTDSGNTSHSPSLPCLCKSLMLFSIIAS